MDSTITIRADVESDSQSTRKDYLDDRIFGNDDNIVLKNILDGTDGKPAANFVFSYNNRGYNINPGQVFRLPGFQAHLFIIHMVKYLYIHVDKKPEMDKRSYPADDKWVKKIVQVVEKSPNPETDLPGQVTDMPEYISRDAEVDEETGLAGRLGSAMSQTGGGESELSPLDAGEAEMTDKQLDKIPDFTAAQNPKVPTEAIKAAREKAEKVETAFDTVKKTSTK